MISLRVALLALCLSPAVLAAPEPAAVPEPLRPWVPWVLAADGDRTCPFLLGHPDEHRCAWPARLELALEDAGGTFRQTWRVDREEWVALPGEDRRWPQDVKVDGKPAVVVMHEGLPSVQLSPGDHVVTGTFAWDGLPESLPVPAATGLLALKVRGHDVAEPNREAGGRVFLQKDPAQPTEAERIELHVHRKVVDDIPLQLETQLVLAVSGKSREVLLGKALPAGFVPMSLVSAIPARVEPDGRLRLQVRRGTWSLTLVARHDGPVKELTRPDPGGQWTEGEEYWVFAARPELRQVQVQGVTAVDPQQTTLPPDWRNLPAYAVKLGETMTLDERRRGDADPPPDRLQLARSLWLDFDGRGYSLQDHISGALNRSWRLEVEPPTELGRVVASGSEQVITRLDGAPDRRAGVEIRQGMVNLTADSRIEAPLRTLPAVGWSSDFHQVSAELHLPPGWRALHIWGADDVSQTWVKQWSLLDLFLILIIAAAVGRLFGWGWGALALATLALTFPEDGAPRYIWLVVLALEPLSRLLPVGLPRTVVRVARAVTWIALVLISVVFMIDHIRAGLYPALERPGYQMGGVESASEYLQNNAAMISSSASGGWSRDDLDRGTAYEIGQEENAPVAQAPSQAPMKKEPQGEPRRKRGYSLQEYDKNVTVQTGPGLPRWDWTTLRLSWSGPVDRGQELGLWLLPPWLNLILAFLRAALLTLMIACVLKVRRFGWPTKWVGPSTRGAAVAAALLLLLPGAARAGELPSKELLDELHQRLLQPPECLPACASASRMLMEVTARTLRARLEVSAAASTAIPLPGSAQQWSPSQVLLDGRPATGLVRTDDGLLWIALGPGNHQISLEGPLPARETVQLPLPLRPYRVDATVSGWIVDGLHEDGIADNDLQLSRTATGDPGEAPSLQQTSLAPFVRVERELVLGLSWEVDTKVVRITPPGSAIVLEVPLLKGESVTSDEVRVQNGKALVNMGPSVGEVSWHSVLDQREQLELAAPTGVAWTEVWRLEVSPLWHVELGGIPVVHQQDAAGDRLPEWRPWPGEKVEITISRPVGVPGQTLTIDQSKLEVSPGLRATDATLTMNLRTSRGGQHVVTLPEGAQLQSVELGGLTQPIRQEGRAVALPLVPGSQSVRMVWREARGIGALYRTPEVRVGTQTVNADLQVTVPQSRWVLFLAGPRMGPSVLFWAIFLVLVGIAVALARLRLTPLGIVSWVLLAMGLSQVPVVAGAIVAGWLLVVGLRDRYADLGGRRALFNLRQLLIAGWALVAAAILFVAIHEGLLGQPDMQISGNGSYLPTLRWFDDRTTDALPQAWILSAPMRVYRGAMLAWAGWLAISLLGWIRWAWRAFGNGGLWLRPPPPPPKPEPIVDATPVGPA